MEQDNPKPDHRVAALEARVAKLERDARALRVIFQREIVPRRESLGDKLRPKIGTFQHYRPRNLKFPQHYLETPVEQPAPTFAIVSPSFEQAEFIGATIDSVLGQNYPAINYLVQDAASSDRTVDVLKGYGDRIRWNSAPDRGQAHALNSGFALVDGDIMAYLNSDDLLVPGTLPYVARAFAADPDLDVVYGHRICIDEDGEEIGRWVLPRHDTVAIKWFDFIPQETMFWRRRVWDKLGGFDESFHYALDWDFILRAHAKGMRFARLPRFLGCFRVHDAQKTVSIFNVGQDESQQLRRVHLGYDPPLPAIRKGSAGYLWRHVLFHRLYKLNILRY
jgi:glycosyltransferase involved in cell wall biosynthesis